MASKKSFDNVNTNRVFEEIDRATGRRGQQPAVTPEEAEERAATLRTQGRKGCKAVRINMAFTPENHEFIKILSKVTGHTMTEFTNLVIEQYRTEHPETYNQAKSILAGILKPVEK